MNIEDKLKELITERYGSVIEFSKSIGIANSTLNSILNRGINNANVGNVIKICRELGISTDELSKGKIVPQDVGSKEDITDIREIMKITKINISTFDLKLDGIPLNNVEKECIFDAMELVVDFVRKNRKREKENAK